MVYLTGYPRVLRDGGKECGESEPIQPPSRRVSLSIRVPLRFRSTIKGRV